MHLVCEVCFLFICNFYLVIADERQERKRERRGHAVNTQESNTAIRTRLVKWCVSSRLSYQALISCLLIQSLHLFAFFAGTIWKNLFSTSEHFSKVSHLTWGQFQCVFHLAHFLRHWIFKKIRNSVNQLNLHQVEMHHLHSQNVQQTTIQLMKISYIS